MAVPAEHSTLNLSGKYVQNKSQSDDTDEILRLQGVGWLTRKAISMATIYQTVTHVKQEDGVEKITVEQVLSGGMGSSSETRILDWQEREHEDKVFGPLLTRTERVKPQDLKNDHLKQGWEAAVQEAGVIHTSGQSDTSKSGRTWIAEMTWGIEEIEGVRKYTRHVFFTGPSNEVINARLVYDYQGPLDG